MKVDTVVIDGKEYYRATYGNYTVYHKDRHQAREDLRALLKRYKSEPLSYKLASVVIKFMKRWM